MKVNINTIRDLKEYNKMLCSQRKNTRLKLDLLNGTKQSDCYYSCKLQAHIEKVTKKMSVTCLMVNTHNEYKRQTKKIDEIGRLILELRGSKWQT